MLRLKTRATMENIKSITKVDTKEPVLVTKEPARVATKEVGIKNVLAILKLREKFLGP
jgi:hypothetical protein